MCTRMIERGTKLKPFSTYRKIVVLISPELEEIKLHNQMKETGMEDLANQGRKTKSRPLPEIALIRLIQAILHGMPDTHEFILFPGHYHAMDFNLQHTYVEKLIFPHILEMVPDLP
ncbi:hypothetical protein AKJ16_DCAP13756 [Drosera capensis]